MGLFPALEDLDLQYRGGRVGYSLKGVTTARVSRG